MTNPFRPATRLCGLTAVMLLTGCASRGPTPTAAGRNDGGPPPGRALQVAKIVPVMPNHAVDLGPVLVSAAQSRMLAQDVLLVEADRLGADGFVAEGRAFGDVYAPSKQWAARHPGAARATRVALGLLGGSSSLGDHPSSVTQQVFYRAYRMVQAAPPPVDVQNVNVPAVQREELASAPDLATQLQVAHLLVATSAIDVSAYEVLRAHLLNGLPAKGPSRPGDM